MPKITDLLATMDYGPSPESADIAQAWLQRHQRRFGHFIGGAWRAGQNHFDSIDPATGKPLAKIGAVLSCRRRRASRPSARWASSSTATTRA